MGGIYPLSDIRANTISDASGNGPINLHKQSAAKAWVNTNTATVDIHSSHGVSTVEDLGPGLFKVNFSSNFTIEKGYSANLTGKMNDNNTNAIANNLHYMMYNLRTESAKSLIVDRVGEQRSIYLANYTFHGDLA
jgi:hypothetical protein